MALTLPPIGPQRGDRKTFADRLDAFITWLINFVAELNIFAAYLNSLAAGGAFSTPYAFSSIPNGDPGGGFLRFNQASQSTTTFLTVSAISAGSQDVGFILAQMADSSSANKGTIRLQKIGDASKWMVFNVTGISAPLAGGDGNSYRGIYVTIRGASSQNPFTNGDGLMLFFQATGDKGDPASLTQVLWVRDEKPSGTAGGSAAASGYTVRTLNTIKKNSIVGASVVNNQIILPAGTYRVEVIAPASNVGSHQMYLFNITDNTSLVGSQAGGSSQSYSLIGKTEFPITGTKTLEVRHYTNTGTALTGLGAAATSGQGEIYTQVFIEKVA